jgi:Protein of unknown function (DUF3500)
VIANYRDENACQVDDQGAVETLSFAWMGSIERGEPYYFRLQGDDFTFEYDNTLNNGHHVHSVWRSKSSDFGADVLSSHYRAEAH